MTRNRFFSIVISGSILTALLVIGRDRLCKPALAACQTEDIESNTTTEIKKINPNYWEYSQNAVKEAHKKGKVVLYFWAPWCTSCASLDDILLTTKQKIPDDVTLLQIPYDHAPILKQKYGITIQHTFVYVDKNDNPIATWVGGDIEELKTHLR